MNNRICILLLEPSFLVREGIKTLLSQIGQAFRIEEVETAIDDLDKLLSRVKPEIAMINPSLLAKKTFFNREADQQSSVVFIGLMHEAVSPNILSKFDFCMHVNDEKSELIKIVEQAYRRLGDLDTDAENNNLSEREISILKLVALGNTNNEIAEKLFISVHTVMTHRKNITRKLGIKTVSGLTVYAILNQLIKVEELGGTIKFAR
jgi:DNA-binding NarL/FixJ family response regulator